MRMLDAVPFPWHDADAQELCGLLAGVYPERARAEAVLAAVGIRERVQLDGSALDRWHSALDVAARELKTRELLGHILRDPGVAGAHRRVRALVGWRPTQAVGAVQKVWNIAGGIQGFCGREETLARLDGRRSPWVVLSGLAGMGKSTLARHWAWRCEAEVCLGWWIRAESREALDEGLYALGLALGLYADREEPWQGAPPPPRAERLGAVRAWLRRPTPVPGVERPELPWLLIVDNAGSPGSLELPDGPGKGLVTTRRRWPGAIGLGQLEREASQALLTLGLVGAGNGDSEAGALAAALGRVPLALAQANAFCLRSGVSLEGCLTRLRRSTRVLHEPVVQGESAAVAHTWGLLVEDLPEASRAVLEILAFFAPEDIPVETLFAVAPPGLSEDAARACGDGLDAAVGPLHAISLVERADDRVDVHRLVQVVTRDRLTPERCAARVRDARALLWVAMKDPADAEEWPRWRRLAPHVEALCEPRGLEAAAFLGQLSYFRWTQGAFLEAKALDERALAMAMAVVGPDHLETAFRLGNLGESLSAAGELEAARARHEDAIRIFRGHPDAPATELGRHLGNLAATLWKLGEHGASLELERQALAVTRSAPVAEPRAVAVRMGNLAAALASMGEPEEANALNEQALALVHGELGPEHPSTWIREGNLGGTLWDLGRHEEARRLVRHTAERFEAHYGPDHPKTRHYRARLAAMSEG